MSKYQALIDTMAAEGLTDCPWEACGPSFGAPRPLYLNEVVSASDDEDDSGPLETVCRAPLGSKDECTADMAYIAEANPATIRALLADLERAEKAIEKIAAIGGEWGPFPETKPEWAAMAIVTARETLDALAQMAGG